MNGRYLGSAEAAWRIFGFPITGRHPAIMKLSIHLENGQYAENAARIINEQPLRTNLMAYFELCQQDHFAQTPLYNEIPTYYT